MPKRYKIVLNEQEKQKLEGWLKNPPSPYLRERARAILKISQGETIEATAQELRVRVHRNAVSEWVQRFLSERLESLKIKVGRGRKAVFSLLGKEKAKQQIEYLLHQSPGQYGLARTRWRLRDVGRALKWLEGCSSPGIYKVLKRLGFSRKRAMNFIHSPDPDYHRKWKAILQAF